jgi:hypothetical protein
LLIIEELLKNLLLFILADFRLASINRKKKNSSKFENSSILVWLTFNLASQSAITTNLAQFIKAIKSLINNNLCEKCERKPGSIYTLTSRVILALAFAILLKHSGFDNPF